VRAALQVMAPLLLGGLLGWRRTPEPGPDVLKRLADLEARLDLQAQIHAAERAEQNTQIGRLLDQNRGLQAQNESQAREMRDMRREHTDSTAIIHNLRGQLMAMSEQQESERRASEERRRYTGERLGQLERQIPLYRDYVLKAKMIVLIWKRHLIAVRVLAEAAGVVLPPDPELPELPELELEHG
jgi:predicted MPP superfamily phosphohydrolase